MVHARGGLTMWFNLMLFVIFISFNDAKLKTNEVNFNLFNFEQIKNELFVKSNFEIPNKIGDVNDHGYIQCSQDLADIRNGVISSEQWALKSNYIWKNYLFLRKKTPSTNGWILMKQFIINEYFFQIFSRRCDWKDTFNRFKWKFV